MLQKIEDINLLQLMKDIKSMILEDRTELKNEDYEIKIIKSNSTNDFTPLIKLLDIMVQENYLVPELYFENIDDFEKCFISYYELNRFYNKI